MRQAAWWVLVFVAVTGAAWAQEPPDKRPQAEQVPAPVTGPTVSEAQADLGGAAAAAVGNEAPGFTLDGSQGRPVKLADLRGHWVALVFDEDCSKLATLQTIAGDVGKLGVSLQGVCPQGTGTLKALAARAQLTFPLLSDPTSEVTELYGLYDRDAGEHVPGLVLVDPAGVVRAMWTGPSLHAPEVLQLLRHSIAGR